MNYDISKSIWLVVWVLWHINFFRSFNAKNYLIHFLPKSYTSHILYIYIYIYGISQRIFEYIVFLQELKKYMLFT